MILNNNFRQTHPMNKNTGTGLIVVFIICSVLILGLSSGLALISKSTMAKVLTLNIFSGLWIALLLLTLFLGKYYLKINTNNLVITAENNKIKQESDKIIDENKININKLKLLHSEKQKISRKCKQLELKQQQLQQKLNTKSADNPIKQNELAAIVHEIRTPLTNMNTLLELLQETELDDGQQDFVDTTQESAKELLQLSNRILDYSKLNEGKLNIEQLPISLPDFVKKLTLAPMKQAEKKGLTLITIIDDNVENSLNTDPTRLKQILNNLLNNALKFTQQGQIKLQISVADSTLPMLMFKVSDTGIGISNEEIKRLFQPFSQAHDSISREYGGTGLGLSICNQLITLMSGKIGVDSVENKGSTFWFTLPVIAATGSIRVKKTAPLKLKQNAINCKILILDSDKLSAGLTQNLLNDMGINSIVSHSTRDVLNKMTNTDFNLIFINENLGDENGFDVCSSVLKTSKKSTCVTLVYQSTSADIIAKCKAAGAKYTLKRPFKRAELVRIIEHCSALFKNKSQANKAKVKTGSGYYEGDVLLVDDNPHNLKVATNVLKLLGVYADEVYDGLQAVKAADKKQYDLILMDCQMPVMDGYEATKKIKAKDKNVPIVAVTANASTSDREKCRISGMNDFLPKPISKPILRQTLKQWLSEKPLISMENFNQTSVELNILEELKDTVGDDFSALISTFLSSGPKILLDIRNAITNKHKDHLVNNAISLSGSCQELGIYKLSEMLNQLKKHGETQDYALASALYDPLIIEYKATAKILKKMG